LLNAHGMPYTRLDNNSKMVDKSNCTEWLLAEIL